MYSFGQKAIENEQMEVFCFSFHFSLNQGATVWGFQNYLFIYLYIINNKNIVSIKGIQYRCSFT